MQTIIANLRKALQSPDANQMRGFVKIAADFNRSNRFHSDVTAAVNIAELASDIDSRQVAEKHIQYAILVCQTVESLHKAGKLN